MVNESILLKSLLIPASFIIGGFVIGIIFEKIILRRIKSIAARTRWQGDSIIIHALHGVTTLWFVIAGAYWALENTEIQPAYLHIIDMALLVAVIFSVMVVLARILSDFATAYSREVGGIFARTSMFTNLTKALVFIVGTLVILQTVGISITPILTALGVGGLAVALALQDTLSNLFAGIHIIASKQVRPGDYVRLDSGQEGRITDISWRYTTIETIRSNMIIVPNSKLAAAVVTNFHLPHDVMTIPIKVGISYDSDLEKVEEITLDVAREVSREVEGGVPDSVPQIRYHTFGDFSIDFNVIVHVRAYADQVYLTHELIKRLHRRYERDGVTIPFPTRTVYVHRQE